MPETSKSITMMPSEASDRRLQEYVALITERCPTLYIADRLYVDLRDTSSTLSFNYINFNMPCTGTDTERCGIFEELTVWNEFLSILCVELKEVVPGKLGLVSLAPYYKPPIVDLQRHRACILIHWLLSKHHCICSVELWSTVIPRDPEVFCDALRLCSGLKSLKFYVYHFFGRMSEDLMNAIVALDGLEELAFLAVTLSTEALSRLSAFLRKTQTLKFFAIDNSTMASSGLELLNGLKCNTSITALCVDDHCLRLGDGHVFGEYLRENMTLKALTIRQVSKKGTCKMEPVFAALETNKILEKLRLESFVLDFAQGKHLAEALIKNNSLRYLELAEAYWSFEVAPFAELIEKNTGLVELVVTGAKVRNVAPFAAAIGANRTLQRLVLNLSCKTVDDSMALLSALASNRTLRELVLGDIKDDIVKDFYALLRETDTEDKIRFRAKIRDPPLLEIALKDCSRLSRICYRPNEAVRPSVLQQAFGQLAACRHVVELTIFLEQEIDDASALLLARFLATTKTLKEVFLRFGTEPSSTRILLEGLACNKSISKLSLMYWSFDRLESELALTLQNITTLNYLSLYSMDTLFVYSIVRDLARCLKKHYSLIVVDINVNGKSKEHEFGIREPLRRNLSLLQQAAQFATGTRNKRSADMFERLCRSEALVWKVQQLSRNTESEAREMIKNSVRYLDVHFMAATGVVREAVVCFGTGDGKMQLDQIGLDNWLRIRSYLRVSDIRDECPSVRSKCP
ncbi:unnamed protein product [Ixodes hexagonus]